MTYPMTDSEFQSRLLAAKNARHLTIDEIARMTNASRANVEKWLNGLAIPYHRGREAVLRAVE